MKKSTDSILPPVKSKNKDVSDDNLLTKYTVHSFFSLET